MALFIEGSIGALKLPLPIYRDKWDKRECMYGLNWRERSGVTIDRSPMSGSISLSSLGLVMGRRDG